MKRAVAEKIESAKKDDVFALASFLRIYQDDDNRTGIIGGFFGNQNASSYLEKLSEFEKTFSEQMTVLSRDFQRRALIFETAKWKIIAETLMLWHQKKINDGDYPFFLMLPKFNDSLLARVKSDELGVIPVTGDKPLIDKGEYRKKGIKINYEGPYVLYGVRLVKDFQKGGNFNTLLENISMIFLCGNFRP